MVTVGLRSRAVSSKTCCGVLVRYELVFWCTMATCTSYLLRNLPSVVLADPQGIASELGWSNEQSGIINSAFYYGYFIAQPFSGALASRFGGVPVLLISATGCILVGAVLPFVAPLGVAPTAALIVIEGIFQSPLYPATSLILALWVLPEERSRAMAIVDGGSYLATGFVMGFGSLACEALGWRALFWLACASLLAWLIAFAARGWSSPDAYVAFHQWSVEREEKRGELGEGEDADKRELERELLLPPQRAVEAGGIDKEGKNENESESEKTFAIYSLFFRSPAVWAALYTPTTINYVIYGYTTFLPVYTRHVLGFSASAAIVLVLPNVTKFIAGQVAAYVCDAMISTGCISVTRARKLFTTLATVVPAAALVTIALLPVEQGTATATMVLFAVAVSFTGVATSGVTTSPIDLAPNEYSGALKGLANGVAQLGGVFSPMVDGLLLQGGDCPKESAFLANATLAEQQSRSPSCIAAWKTAFLVCAAVATSGAIVFGIFGSGESLFEGEDEDGAGEGEGSDW